MSHKKNELPGWFPFAIVATGLVMVGAGIRAKWKLPADQTPPPAVPPQQASVLNEWFG